MNALFRFSKPRLPAFPDTPMPLPSCDGMLKLCGPKLKVYGWLLLFILVRRYRHLWGHAICVDCNIVDWLGVHTPAKSVDRVGDMLRYWMLAVMIVSPLWLPFHRLFIFKPCSFLCKCNMFSSAHAYNRCSFYQDGGSRFSAIRCKRHWCVIPWWRSLTCLCMSSCSFYYYRRDFI